MEKAKVRKIKKWDEFKGEYEESEMEGGVCEPEEANGVGPSISRNPMRGIEDMVEQNDNNLDGVINNVKVDDATGILELIPDEKKSVIEKLKEQDRRTVSMFPIPERKQGNDCPERELRGW